VSADGRAPAAGPRVLVVTGAASGIGAAVRHAFVERGWTVAGLDLHADASRGIHGVDVSDSTAVSRAVRDIEAEHGVIDAALTAAGHYEMLPVAEIDDERWRRMLRVHLGGAVNIARAVVPGMRSRGRGCLVCITSELAIGGGGGDAHYAAAKGGVIGLVRSLAIELAPVGVRVNGIAPGPTDTPLLAADSPWRDPGFLATLPAGRLASPDEIARTAVFLVEDADFVSGEIVSPNSGAVI